jgi:hypothetical protein
VLPRGMPSACFLETEGAPRAGKKQHCCLLCPVIGLVNGAVWQLLEGAIDHLGNE